MKHYEITLKTKGPVFVGSGKEYQKNEYLIFNRENRVDIVDIAKVYKIAFRKKIAKQFEDFFLRGKFTIGSPPAYGKKEYPDLNSWFRRANYTAAEKNECILYSLHCDDMLFSKGKRTQIMEFIKDSYKTPYVPGSSLKGALRTILAIAKIAKDERLKEKLQNKISENLPNFNRDNRTRYLKQVASFAEEKIFRLLNREDTRENDAVNDIMQGFIVGDSAPLKTTDLTLAKKIERHVDGKELELPIIREAIKPGVKITFPLTIDEKICDIDDAKILEAIYTFDEIYSQNFLKAFKGADILRGDIPQIFLGGGTGFVGKTLVYPIFGKTQGIKNTVTIFKNTNVPREHKHEEDVKQGASPHILKCTHYNGESLQMGLCEFDIK